MRDVSLTRLAEELNRRFGYSFTQSNLSRKLNTDTVKWSELRDITAVLGYNIRISPSIYKLICKHFKRKFLLW